MERAARLFFPSPRSLSLILLSIVTVLFESLSFSATALAKSDSWANCRDADVDARIVACSNIIAGASRKARRYLPTAYINRGVAFRLKGDADRALSDLDQALRLDPKSSRASRERASIRYAKGDYNGAIADYDAAIAAEPESAAAFCGRGDAYKAIGDVDRAIANYGKAVLLDKNQGCAYAGRANAYFGKAEVNKALADFDEAVRLRPGLASIRIDRGLARQAAGDLDRAIADYSEAILIDTNSVNAFLGRASAYREKQDLERARRDLEAALKLDPNLAAAREALAELDKPVGKDIARPSPEAPSLPPPEPATRRTLPEPLALLVALGLVAPIAARNLLSRRRAKRLAGGDSQAVQDGYLASVSRLTPEEACERDGSIFEGLSKSETRTPKGNEITAGKFRALVKNHELEEDRQRADSRRVALEMRKQRIRELAERRLTESDWRKILLGAQASAEQGMKEFMLMRFPSQLCTDGGRAINAPDPNWPETLQGEPADIFSRWLDELKPKGFQLAAQIVDFPGGVPGDAALFLIWGA